MRVDWEQSPLLLGAADASRIVFTLNCTEALNLALKGMLKRGDHVVVTGLEHNSVLRPLRALAAGRGITVMQVEANERGETDADAFGAALRRRNTALAVMTHASNVTGAIQPVEECGRMARDLGIPFLVDAAQTAGCVPLDVSRLPVDLLAFSGHKGMLGPQGVGGLYIREGMDIAPLKEGGTGSGSSEETQPRVLPDRYESGTPNTPGIVGLSAAAEYLSSVTVEAIRSGIVSAGDVMLSGLCSIKGVALHAPADMTRNAGIFSFTVDGSDPAELAAELDERYGIMTRVGLHCAPAAHRAIGTFPAGTIRASIGCFTSPDEIEYFLHSLRAVT